VASRLDTALLAVMLGGMVDVANSGAAVSSNREVRRNNITCVY